ncbi:MAG: excinuclease ABC subunit UvrC [Candidatus Limnocylindrus sp.]|jgi:excinuclease ABC subunit C
MTTERLPAPKPPAAVAAALAVLPDAPGVYLFSDSSGTVIYVGKAARLTQRVRSYWQAGAIPGAHRIRDAIDQVATIDWTVTDSPSEALLLESRLVKRHLPRYNVRLRDDRSYPYIRVTNEPYPRVERTRRIVRDGSHYFGPYTTPGAVNAAMSTIQRLFAFRTCDLEIAPEQRAIERPCLLFHLKRCQGPCTGEVTVADYRQELIGVEHLLAGRTRPAIAALRERMDRASDGEAFEDAARLRDAIGALEQTFEAQRVPTSGRPDEDVLGLARRGGAAAIACFQVRDSALVGREVHRLEAGEASDAEVLAAFIGQHYARAGDVPPSVATAVPVDDADLASLLATARPGGMEFRVPLRGDRVRLLRLAERNAEERLIRGAAEEDADRARADAALAALVSALKLDAPPARIECADVSTIQGAFTVSSLVVAIDGQPTPKEYRRFKIKEVDQQDDFAAHREALRRRFARATRAGERAGQAEEEAWGRPDLLVIDGGRGQVSAAAAELDAAGVEVTLIGLAKEREEIWVRGATSPINLPATDPGLRLLQRLRDEAHRFAIGYHRTLRSRAATESRLDAIRGLGPARRKALLRRFGSAAGVAAAPLAEIAALPGIGRALATRILEELGAGGR